jgi:site-specific recombinase XerD
MATLALSNGTADVVILQRLLGLESLATTGKYTDLIKDDLIRAVQMNPVTGIR